MNDLTKYFFNRCFELLNNKTFDTYRVSLHNPYTIFRELEKGIESFNKKRIKNFNPTITSIGDEAKLLLTGKYTDDILIFKTFTKKQIEEILVEKCIKGNGDYNRTISLMCKAIIVENTGFTKNLFNKIAMMLIENNMENSHKIDKYASWLITQLIYRGYSRKFVSNRFRFCSILLSNGKEIDQMFEKLSAEFSKEREPHKAIFKLKSESLANLKFASQAITKLDKLPDFLLPSNTLIQNLKSLKIMKCTLK